MKTKLALLMVSGALLGQLPGTAQTDAKQSASKASVSPGVGPVEIPNTPIDEALRLLAAGAGINVDIDPKVAGGANPDGTPMPVRTISVSYPEITPFNALLATLENNELQLITNAALGTYRVTVKDMKALPPLVTQVLQLKYGTTNVVPIIKATLTDTRAQVLANERASQLIIVATEKEMEVARVLVEELDVAPKQVLIEAKILETSINPKSIRGIDWSGTLEGQNFGFGNGTTTGTTTTTIPGPTTTSTTILPGGGTVTSSSTSPQSQATALTTALGLPGFTANTFSGINPALGILNADGVRGVLSFMNANSETEVVANPSAVTLDNQEARLEVVRSFPVYTQNPGSVQVPSTTTLTYTNVGTILIVTPRVSANSNVSMKVTPEVSNIDGQNSQTINGEVNSANVYASRKITTQVLIPSGNTLVMGGLISDTSTKSNSKVPILGDTPGFGLLFRRDTKARTKQNLVIFVTPTIVQDFDFQYTPSSFLRSSPDLPARPDEGPWDSGKPKQWGRSK